MRLFSAAWTLAIGSMAMFGFQPELAVAQGGALVVGSNAIGQCNVPTPPPGLHYIDISAGGDHTVALRSDGSVVAWGYNSSGQCNVASLPAGLTYVEIDAGGYHTVALRSDGSAVAWGNNTYGQCSVPALPSGVVYVTIAAGENHTVALCSDGNVVAWGWDVSGQCNVPALPSGVTYIQVAASYRHSAACRSDGAVVAWGNNSSGQCNVTSLPTGLLYVEVAAGWDHTIARRSDGAVVAWGSNVKGQCNVPTLPPSTSYVGIAADSQNSAARRSDGTAVVWGSNLSGQCNLPTLAPGLSYVALSSGYQHTAARHTRRFYRDLDQDGYGNSSVSLVAEARPVGYVLTGGDCDDTRPSVYPGAPDVCDGLDNDCNGTIDPGFISTYCTAGTTVFGCVPSISGEGAPSSSSSSGFDIVVSNVPAQRYGLIFYGSWSIPQPQPWGLGSSSYLCIYLPTARTGVQDTGGVAGTCTGELRVDFNQFMANNPAATGSPFHAGQVLHAQGWFRDPGAAKQTNLSNALTFTLCN